MDQRTLKYLTCVAISGERLSKAQGDAHGLSICGGELIQRDSLTLLCTRCETEYPIKSGIPQLLPKNVDKSSYMDDDVIQKYYEMHYGPNITGPQVKSRLCFPQPNLLGSSSKTGRKIDVGTDIHRFRQGVSKELQDFYGCLAHLVGNPCLSEDFYQCILELSRPMLNANSIVLDVGCGLGRMTAEIAKLGAAFVMGLDRSQRMTEEAAKIVRATGSIPINLNLVGGKTVGVELSPTYQIENADFVVGEAECLPFQQAAIDLALAINLLDRVSNPCKVIVEIARILKSGGYLVVTHPYQWEEGPAEQKYWVADMAMLFDPDLWTRDKEVDGIPFVMRGSSRRITMYMNHCLIYRKIRE